MLPHLLILFAGIILGFCGILLGICGILIYALCLARARRPLASAIIADVRGVP